MNTKKTNVMVISKTGPPKVNIKVKGKCIEQIEQFKYLGQLITTDARSDDEIKSRITITKSAFTKLSHILTSKRVGLLTRLRVMKCFVWSPFLYATFKTVCPCKQSSKMPKTKQADTNKRPGYNKWKQEDMKTALDLYRAQRISLNEIPRQFRISKAAFLRHEVQINTVMRIIKAVGRDQCFLLSSRRS
ncbi:craniofacial development protein 2 [Elysia marginata]|uniref:Craniofacial development protein 2 n=1 Tax=Elysia marginata TaxID=1093978 RepID=A0AAV4GJ16_9GAST|nr:craniofacial development protein 2 [Elysia marginata]